MAKHNLINNKPDPDRTQNAVMVFGASGVLSEKSLNDGQLIIGNTGNAPSAAALASAGGTITITNGAGTIDLAVATAPVIGASAALAYQGSNINNATGDGTVIGNFGTEVYDVAGNFSSSTTFTAPATGKYFLEHSIYLGTIGAGHTSYALYMYTSNRTYYWNYLNSAVLRNVNNDYQNSGCTIADMDNGDIAQGVVAVAGSTKTITYVFASAASNMNCVRFL